MGKLKKKMQNAYLKIRHREKGGMEITAVIGLVIIALVILIIVRNMLVANTKTMSNKTTDAVNKLYNNTETNQSMDTDGAEKTAK